MNEGENYNSKNNAELERMISTKDRYSQIYRRKQFLLNILQATTTQCTKIFQGHTDKILYVRPLQRDNLPRMNKSLREQNSRTDQKQENLETMNEYFPQKKKINLKPVRYFKAVNKPSQSQEKQHQLKIDSRQLQPSSSFKLPFVENDKKFSRVATEMNFSKELDYSSSSANQFKRYFDAIAPKAPEGTNKKKSVAFNQMRPATKNTKLFNYVVKQDFSQKDQQQDDQLSEIDYFHDYVYKNKF